MPTKKSGFLSVLIIAVICLFSFVPKTILNPKDMIGAWVYGPDANKVLMICTDKIFAVSNYDLPGKRFLNSYGGTWRVEGDKIIKKIEWNSADTTQVGKEMVEQVQITPTRLVIKKESWNRLDDGTPGALQGAWIITGNYKNDSVSKRANPFYPRRTMKVLSGKYFQWIAYNVATKSFMNAGGGTYTTNNGKYTENIEFFTKTKESIGKNLVFDYSFVNGDWRHKGQKSTGGAMDECWSKRETLEK